MQSRSQNTAKLVPITLWLLMLLAADSVCAEGFHIESKAENGQRSIILHNDTNSPLSIKLTLPDSHNLASDQDWPIITSVAAHSEYKAATVYAQNPNLGYSYNLKSEYLQGDYQANPVPDTLYRLPFKDGMGFYISQAADGPKTTHTQADSFYAIDFTMPEGTPVVAARDGVVIKTEASFHDGGNLPELISKANMVKILHEDGTMAGYAHLRFGGVTVREGDQVKAGELIGFSGSTGYSTGPHLHFAVVRIAYENEHFVEKSIPVRLYVGKPALSFTPKMGMLTMANYQSPATMPDTQAASAKKHTQLWKPGYWVWLLILSLALIFALIMRVKVEKTNYRKMMDEINQEYDRYNS